MFLKDKVLLITGSSRGIGAAVARLAKTYGATVVVHGKTESEALKGIAQELDSFYVAADVSDKAAVEAAVAQAAERAGRLDGLINSAGIAMAQPFLETDDAHWEAQFRTNVLGTVHFCQAVIPHMQAQGGGRIVNVGSIRGDHIAASARGMAYAASKASIVTLTTSLAKAFAPTIAVNAVAPGMTATDISKDWNETVWQQAKTSLVGRVGKPEEIAEVLLFLVSNRASYVNGQTLTVDGGYEIAGK